MCLFTSARTVAIVLARSAGSEAMYCAGVLTFDGGFMDSSSSRTSEGSAIAYLKSSICMIKARFPTRIFFFLSGGQVLSAQMYEEFERASLLSFKQIPGC